MNSSRPYISFIGMLALSFAAMYILMYAMVDVFAHALPNVNQLYMAGLMTAPMAVFELLLMRSMYPNKKLNIGIIMLSVLVLAFCWTGIRQQIGIGDEQFLASMIPHHSGAILMCEKAKLTDPEIRELCQNIIASQQDEIERMQKMLDRLQ